jgi:hypothetical protein
MITKRNLTSGILIGIGIIVLPLILMGTTYTTEKQNKFEVHMGNGVSEGILLNTETGETWFIYGKSKTKHQ